MEAVRHEATEVDIARRRHDDAVQGAREGLHQGLVPQLVQGCLGVGHDLAQGPIVRAEGDGQRAIARDGVQHRERSAAVLERQRFERLDPVQVKWLLDGRGLDGEE